ncbi:hypothetical protein D6C67_24745, partial [Escherichia coli]
AEARRDAGGDGRVVEAGAVDELRRPIAQAIENAPGPQAPIAPWSFARAAWRLRGALVAFVAFGFWGATLPECPARRDLLEDCTA